MGTLAKIEGYLLTTGVRCDVPLVIEMDDVFKALEYTVVQIGLHKVWRWSLVYASQARCLEETPELRDVTRHLLVESRPIRGGIWVGAQTVIEVIGPQRVIPVRIGVFIGLLAVRISNIFWNPYVRVTVHRECVFPASGRLYCGYGCGGMAGRTLGLTEK